jgi:acyl-CoA synthetase (AMP-forming)/AMP-acid ligase II
VQSEKSYLAEIRRLHGAWREPDAQPTFPRGEQALTDYLRDWARDTPDATAIIHGEESLTFAELEDRSNRLAGHLRERAGRGDRVAIMLPNSAEYVVAFFAVLKAGSVVVPVNPWFTDYEIDYELNDSGAVGVVTDSAHQPVVERLRHTTSLGFCVLVDQAAPADVDDSGFTTTWDDAMAHEPLVVEGPGDLDAMAVLNYTGGTTGLPKGCVHTQRDMVYTAATAVAGQQINGADEVSLVYIPIFWIAGEDYAILIPVLTGTPVILLGRWDPRAVLEAIARHRVTAMLGTVDNYIALLDHPDRDSFDLSSLRTPLTMSFVTRLNPDIRRRWRAATGQTLREAGLGITETHAVDASTTGFQENDEDLLSEPVFCGLPVPGTDVKVLDFETRELVPLGEPGELAIRSPSLFKAYWNRPDETAAAFADGWFLTGDIGMIDTRGLIHLLGRRKEMIKVNGMSVFPNEIEVALVRHPDVAACGVVGVPDARRGERPVAFVQLEDGAAAETGSETLTAWCATLLSSFKVPEVRVVDTLPYTTTGKVKKDALRERVLVESAAAARDGLSAGST